MVRNGCLILVLPTLLCRFCALAIMGRLVLLKKGHEDSLEHEFVHIRQQREMGAIKYHWKWIMDSSFRARVEIEAYTNDGLSDEEIADKLVIFYEMDITAKEVKQIREDLQLQ